MQVEIYDERELNPETLTREPDAEALDIIAELGLTAQTNESGSRIAYPSPTEDQGLVLNFLFPAATALEKYDAGGIPLRVLKEIRSYRAENPDHLLLVRHAPPAAVTDPVLLAYTETGNAWMATHSRITDWRRFRIIARWGDALEPWSSLADKAAAIAGERATTALRSIIRKAEGAIAQVKETGWRSPEMPQLFGLPDSL